MNKYPKVTVGVLTWNQKKDVLECLESIVRMTYPNYDVVVIDNGSRDGTSEAVKEHFPNVHYVYNSENLGCAEGQNCEIREAIKLGSEYLFTIANDAIVEPSTLTELVREAEKDPRIAFAFPKVYHYGTNKIWFAKGARISEIDWRRGLVTGHIQNTEDNPECDIFCDADIYPGGFCMVRLEAVQKGGFLNTSYNIFFDDTEWQVRVIKAGYRGRYVPTARTWHKPSSSLGMESERFYYYRTRNRLRFFSEYSPKRYFIMFLLRFFSFELPFETLYRLCRSGAFKQAAAVLEGIKDFFLGKKGMWRK